MLRCLLPLPSVILAVEGCISSAAIALYILSSLSEACVDVCRLRPVGHALCKHTSIRNLTPSQGQPANTADSADAGAQGQHSLQAHSGTNPRKTRGASLVGCASDGGLHCRKQAAMYTSCTAWLYIGQTLHNTQHRLNSNVQPLRTCLILGRASDTFDSAANAPQRATVGLAAFWFPRLSACHRPPCV
jgi:hypothetical protein